MKQDLLPELAVPHGYGIVGKRIYGNVDSAKRPRISLIGGYLNNKLIAPILFDGNCNTLMINLWLKDHILPTLKKIEVIVMDNTSFHKSQETRDIIKNTECFVLFLPPYSPHLYPVEKLCVNIKQARKYELSRELDRILISSDFIWN